MAPRSTEGSEDGHLPPKPSLRARLRALYDGESPEATRFRYTILVFDIVAVAFVVATSFMEPNLLVERLDLVFGALILLDFGARLWISRHPMRFLLNPYSIVDIVTILSFLLPLSGEGLAFLRILRLIRITRAYQTVNRLKRDFPFFRRYQEVIVAAVNLFVFVFVMTGLVYETQHAKTSDINNYADALYFTVTALTTTGFGDITLEGTSGRLLSVLIMLCGVTLFLRLAQVIFRPHKVRFPCPHCGLSLHDADAVHCKHCGNILNIPDEGLV